MSLLNKDDTRVYAENATKPLGMKKVGRIENIITNKNKTTRPIKQSNERLGGSIERRHMGDKNLKNINKQGAIARAANKIKHNNGPTTTNIEKNVSPMLGRGVRKTLRREGDTIEKPVQIGVIIQCITWPTVCEAKSVGVLEYED